DLRGPKLLNLLRMFGRIQHAPSIDTQLAVGKRDCGQFHAHAIKLGDESFNVEIQHFFPSNSRLERSLVNGTNIALATVVFPQSAVQTEVRSRNPVLPSIAAAAGSPLPLA